MDCAVAADVDSIQDYWTQALGGRYTATDTVFFSGQVQTSCGAASSGSGPFYCPGDQLVYIDLSFFDQLKSQFGAEGGAFVDAYVLAHEYGHHVQDLLGTNQQVTPGETGPTSGSVRLELQADCYAGTWANHATTVPDDTGAPLIAEITQDDIARALDAAVADRRRLHPAEPRQRPGRPELVHARLVGAAAEVVHHRLPDRRSEPVRHLRHQRPRLKGP